MALILIAEDEKRIQQIIADYAERDGHEVLLADDGIDALAIVKKGMVDLLILDIMMPNMDGFSVCKQVREISDLPIIMLTAKQEETDKLKGYGLGTDDYVTKPFSPNLLMAKVKVLLRRTGHKSDHKPTLNAGKIILSPTSREVTILENQLDLTYTEFELLHLFMKNPHQVFSREQLLNLIWGYDFEGTSRTVDVHVKNLRQKLGNEGRHIVTLIRSGYKFEVMEDA
ncbi:response regulator transcription factor [Enterococcus sp. AZ109]|uniref:response regulator transcription factor n=1 Tax=Enterococcus sp. AZ109 TaxID=2774634 RepID=UPI003F1F0D9E